MLISLSLGRSSALGARLKIRQHYSSPLALGGNNSSSLGATPSRHQGLESAVDRPTNVVAYDRKLSRSLVSCLMERAELVARALDFLVRVTDADMPLDEALNALSAL